MRKIVVIGMSAASISFVVKLRSFDKESEVICFSGEKDMPYNRCLLADVLTGEIDFSGIALKPDDFFLTNNITVRLDSWVTKIDSQHKKIYVGDEIVFYDYLFLGTGTSPVVPKFVKNINIAGVFNFHTIADMENIKSFIAEHQPRSALVIGGGLNGIEAVSSLHDLNISVGVVEAGQSILSGQVEATVAQFLSEKMCKQYGVTIFAGRRASKILSNSVGIVSGVQLETGAIITTDLVIIAAGSQVNGTLAMGAGLEMKDGSILVNKHMQTSVDGILAAGDVCLVQDMVTGQLVRSTTWSDAMLQGLCAATNFSSAPRAYQGAIGLRDSHFFGESFYAAGNTINHDESFEIVSSIDEQHVKKVYLQDGCVKGFVLFGDLSSLSELKRLYVTQKLGLSLID